MNIDYGNWGSQILFASACIVVGIVGVVLARNGIDRWLRLGLLLQAILLAFVVSAAFFQRQTELKLGGVVIVGLLIVQSTLGSQETGAEQLLDAEPAQLLDEEQPT